MGDGAWGEEDRVNAVVHSARHPGRWRLRWGFSLPRRRDRTGGHVFFNIRGFNVLEGLGNVNLYLFRRCGGARGVGVARCTGFSAEGGEGDSGIISERRAGEGRRCEGIWGSETCRIRKWGGKLVRIVWWSRDDWRTSERNRPRLRFRGRGSKWRWIIPQWTKTLR